MKFSPIRNFDHVCKAWESHGQVNEDRTVVFTSSPIDRCNFLEASDPLGKLKELLTRFTLSPMFETSGGHFGRMRLSNWSKSDNIKNLTEPGQLFDKVMGGWEFSGNFHDLSCCFSVYIADKEVARELFELVIANYSSDKYKNAVNHQYRRTTCFKKYKDNEVSDVQSEYVVYFNAKRGGLYVARPNEEVNLPITEERAKHLRDREGNWLMHAFYESERIGSRNEVDYAELLKSKLPEILK
ncbi:hypothetical protein VPHK45_0047 [Vibrio phage K45]